jgi:hypothetical protein
MRAALVDQPDAPLRVAKQHEVLAQQPHPHGRAVARGDALGERDRDPVAAHQLAHGRAGPHSRQPFVVFARQHG